MHAPQCLSVGPDLQEKHPNSHSQLNGQRLYSDWRSPSDKWFYPFWSHYCMQRSIANKPDLVLHVCQLMENPVAASKYTAEQVTKRETSRVWPQGVPPSSSPRNIQIKCATRPRLGRHNWMKANNTGTCTYHQIIKSPNSPFIYQIRNHNLL